MNVQPNIRSTMAASRHKHPTTRNEIADLVATLAGRQTASGRGPQADRSRARRRADAGAWREHGGKIWALLDDEELRELSIVMSSSARWRPRRSRACCSNSSSRLSASGALLGNYDATERLLQQYLPADRVAGIMEEIRGPAGRNMWEKLSNVKEEVLANYLKNEYPQTVAVVLSKIKPEHAARVLATCPRSSPSMSSSACCGWKRCRRTSSRRSNRRCVRNSCRIWRARAAMRTK